MLDEARQTATRRLSSAVFNNSYFLEVVTLIADAPEDTLTTRVVAARLDLPDNIVATVVKRLRRGMLLDEAAPRGTERPFSLVESPMWDCFRMLSGMVSKAG